MHMISAAKIEKVFLGGVAAQFGVKPGNSEFLLQQVGKQNAGPKRRLTRQAGRLCSPPSDLRALLKPNERQREPVH